MTDLTSSLGIWAPRRGGILSRLADMRRLARERSQLAALDPARLNDLGLTRSEAMAEAARPAWDVPANWRR